MKRTEKNLYLLCMFASMLLITANCIAAKVWDLGFTMFGYGVTLTTGALCYPFLSMVTDTINELWGDKTAKHVVWGGFAVQTVSTLFIVIARYMPAADPVMQESYVNLLGQNWVFVVASLTAYLVSSFTDIYFFGKIRNAQESSGKLNGKGRNLRAAVSTILGQGIDSLVYVLIAFGLGFGWLFNGSAGMMFNMILAQWLIKVALSFIGLPLFHIFTRRTANG